VATGTVRYITEVNISDEIYWLLSVEGGTGWYLPNNALAQSLTFTADTTNTNTTLTNVSSFSGLYVGQALTGSGIASGARIASMNSGAGTLVMTIAATATASTVTITRTHLAKIIDSDFPSTAQGPFVELDGTVYIGTTEGTIRGSDLNSIVAWSASNEIQTPDSSIVVEKHNDQIAAVGKNKISFYFNAGNAAGSLLSRSSSPEINMGTSDFFNVIRFRDWIFFVGQDTGPETSGIWMLDGFSLTRLTSIPLTRMLSENEASLNAATITLSAFEHQGKQFVYFGMGDSTHVTAQYLYCMESKEWVEAGFPYLLKFSEGLNAVSLSTTSGIVYTSNVLTPTYQDVGAASYTATIQTITYDWGTSYRKSDRDIVLMCDVQSSGTATLETSDDDYVTWVTRGTFDLTQNRPKISRGGSYKGKRAYRVTHSANTPFRAWELEIDVTVENT
jgi:hypothetical protein